MVRMQVIGLYGISISIPCISGHAAVRYGVAAGEAAKNGGELANIRQPWGHCGDTHPFLC